MFPAKTAEYKTVSPGLLKNTQASKEENERGLSFVQHNQFDAAEKAFRQALEHDVSNAAAHNNLGLVLLAKHRFYESAVEFRLASKLDRGAVEPLMNLGRLYEMIGWEREANKQHENAEQLRISKTDLGRERLGDGRNNLTN